MNKSELIDSISDAAGMTKADATKSVNALFEVITSELSKGEQVVVPGFGTFTVANRAARTGRNPRTGEPLDIAAARIPKFKPGKSLKEAVDA